MNSSNPRLVGLWVATYPGLKAGPITCYGCGERVPPRQKCYRLRAWQGYDRRGLVGYLCRPCRQILGLAQTGHRFTRIEAVEERQAKYDA